MTRAVRTRIQPTTRRNARETAGSTGTGGAVTKIRWLQQAWWRYLQARWGYSTNIHSWELLNEGDPLQRQPLHPGQTSSAHTCTSSSRTTTWSRPPSGIPSRKMNFWANPEYQAVDFADIHQYIPQSDPLFDDTALATDSLSLQVGAKQSGGAGKPVIRGETG